MENPPEGHTRRILVVGANYHPEPSGIAPYTSALAEHLAGRGHQVVVLTAVPSYPAWRVYDGYRATLRQVRVERGVEVRRFRSFVPARQSAIRRAGYEVTFLAHASTRGPLRGRPDLVLGVVPTLSGGVLAKFEALRHRRPYGLVVQDLMGPAATESGIAGGARVAGATRRIEAWVARGAAGVAVIAEPFRAYLESLGVAPERIVKVPNWSHLRPVTESRQETRARLGWPADAQVVLHTGNMGLKQGLEHLLAAARLAARDLPRSRFVLVGDGNQRASLQSAARSLANLDLLGLVDEAAYANLLSAADVLVVTERAGMASMALPSKLTSYFAAGRPVLAAVPAGSPTAGELRRADAGLVVAPGDPAAFVAALGCLGADAELARRLGEAGARFADAELSPASCLARADAFVEALMPPGPRAGSCGSGRRPMHRWPTPFHANPLGWG